MAVSADGPPAQYDQIKNFQPQMNRMDADENPRISLFICVHPVHLRFNSSFFMLKLTVLGVSPDVAPSPRDRVMENTIHGR